MTAALFSGTDTAPVKKTQLVSPVNVKSAELAAVVPIAMSSAMVVFLYFAGVFCSAPGAGSLAVSLTPIPVAKSCGKVKSDMLFSWSMT
jgi:hypothetical protein